MRSSSIAKWFVPGIFGLSIALGILLLSKWAELGSNVSTASGSQQAFVFEWPRISAISNSRDENTQNSNVTVWPTNRVSCTDPFGYVEIGLYLGKNNEPLRPVQIIPQAFLREMNGSRFPSLEFNELALDKNTEHTSLVVGSKWNYGTVAIYGTEYRTIQPTPFRPTGIAKVISPGEKGSGPWELDSRIQIVWPHNKQGELMSSDRATFVNVAVDYFKHNSSESVPVDYPTGDWKYSLMEPYLTVAEGSGPFQVFGENNDPLKAKQAQRTSYLLDGREYPRWVFNDIPVTPGRSYHFIALWNIDARAAGFRVYPSVWTHTTEKSVPALVSQGPPNCIP